MYVVEVNVFYLPPLFPTTTIENFKRNTRTRTVQTGTEDASYIIRKIYFEVCMNSVLHSGREQRHLL